MLTKHADALALRPGILHVTAAEKSTGRNKKIEIRNDTGRLSQAEIQRMINEADEFRDEDQQTRQRVHARHRLETYLYACKQALDEYRGSTISPSEMSSMLRAWNETRRWLDTNQSADTEQFDEEYQALERKCQRVMAKPRASDGKPRYGRPASYEDDDEDEDYSGPRIEEVD